ncbi:MAG: hypothetical protein CTY35_07635 [Methylotenera sp.]|nr:MAG: hypothetical protein CTY35_07635 [Methylotenera sp.]
MEENKNKQKFELFELGTVDEVVARFGGIKLLEEIQYEVPPVPMFGEQCPNADAGKSHLLRHPAIYYAKVSDYKMIGSAAFPIIQNKSIRHQFFSAEYWETSEQAMMCCYIREEQNLIGYTYINSYQQFTCSVINLVGNGSYNFAHWMTEFLPQLVLLRNAAVDLSGYKVLVDSRAFPSMLEALFLLGVSDEQLIKIDELSLNEFPEALWVSPVANVVFQRPKAMLSSELDKLTEPYHTIFHPEVLRITRDTFIGLMLEQPYDSTPEKIFIKRFPGRRYHARSIINEYAIQHKLEAEGFVSIEPSRLTFTEQIKFFSKAKYIVGASGAALLNMIWAPQGAKVIVLMNDSKVANYWYFSNIAFSVGHQLSYVLGKIDNTGNWHDIHHADFEIDLGAVVSALESAGLQIAEHPAVNKPVSDALEIAKLYQASGHLDKATAVYLDVLEIEPEHAEANHNLGLIEAQCQDAVAALGRFERAVLAKPEVEQYWVSYIESLIQTGAMESVADALDLGMNYGLRAAIAQKLAANVIDGFDIN